MARNLIEGMQCVRYMLFTTNFMFLMIGFLLICVGSLIKLEYTEFETFMERHYYSPASLTVAVGGIILFVAVFGCLGAIKESTCLINLYALCLSVILVLEVAAAIAAFTMRSNIRESVKSKMEDSMAEYNTSSNTKFSWDYLQESLECCGVDSFKDWKKIFPSGQTGDTTSVECTKEKAYCYPRSCTYKYSGCLDRLSYWISESASLLGIGASCVAFVQLMGVIFARILAGTIRSLKTQMLVERQQRREELYSAIHATSIVGGIQKQTKEATEAAPSI